MIAFDQALQLTLEATLTLGVEDVPLLSAVDRVTAQSLIGQVDSPSVDVSLKDGYAVHSADIANAGENAPVSLKLLDAVAAAGDASQHQVEAGTALRVLSGAPIPAGADAVVAEEFTQQTGDALNVTADAHPGRNILPQGSDVRTGRVLVEAGVRLAPPVVGFLAAAGYEHIPVVRKPRVAILATGDEVVAPGKPLLPGKLYASNLVTLGAWCCRYGWAIETFVVPDDATLIREKMQTCLQGFDALLTSGGAWSGERDLVVHLLDQLGWVKHYHRVRIGPGKAVAFGLYGDKPVFCLPGGPPSNHMAFLQLALVGLHKLAGFQEPGLPVKAMRLAETVRGQSDWTQFIHGRLEEASDLLVFVPLKAPSRLQMMAHTEAIIKIPEGQTELPKGAVVKGQVLR